MPAISPSGGIIGNITQYGYANDPQMDKLTLKKLGMRDNTLTPHAAALTDSMAQQVHANPGDVIEIVDPNGNKRLAYYGDRAPEPDPRVDLYQPQGFDKSIPDKQQVINLGGGSPTLRGQQLSTTGEANVQKFLTPSTPAAQPEMQTQQQPSAAPATTPATEPGAMPMMPGFALAPQQAPAQNVAQMNNFPTSQKPISTPSSGPGVDNYLLGRLFSQHPLFASLVGGQPY
jgi:hypothetical protein